MRLDDPDSYSYGYNNSLNNGDPFWKYGAEIWCNLKGQYVTLVADLAHLSGQSYEMSICALGLMGVEYVRDSEPPLTTDVYYMESKTISIENAYAV